MTIARSFRLAAFAAFLGAAVSTGALAQTLTIGVRAGPESIDPHYTATGTHAEALKHVFDTLIWSGDQLQLEPRLATSWKAIEPSVWEFKLRPGVKFHDGSDFTAEDVKFSIERIPTVAGPNPTTIYVRRVKEVKIIDPLTVQVVTDGPAPNLPNDFIRLFIVSHKAAAGLTKDNANEAFNTGKAAIGTGPYKFVSWTPKDQLVLDRFDGYWGEKQPWAKVLRKELPNDAARVAQLKAGQVDIIVRAPASDVPTLKRDPKLTVATVDSVYLFNLELDLRDKAPQVTAKDGSALPKNPLQDAKVREAIDTAIDRPTLVEIAMEGLGATANQLVTPTIAGFNKSLPALKPDVAKARKLMEEAGYANGFKVTFSFTNDRLPGDRQVGTSIAQMLARIGIEVVANAQPGAVFFPARARAEYSMAMSGWGTLTGEANYTLSSLVHSNDPAKKLGAFNLLGYKNAEVDKLIEDAGIEMDEAKRNKMLSDVAAIVAKERPRLSIASVGSAWAMQKDKVTIKPRVDEDTLAMDIKPAK
ncbi:MULTISPECIES: ABC transporter substrate-binding protein [unclassified Bosea (in: a-proteobacteria)]|uniref:ABC transporter substrate-binding protein n=1 Tax=unclassified Bosea (in: a-proteobacteria) TaxID=2653178 RepID=UPI0009571970|nr:MULTISPECIES: ABC transporter substrate-binding protein [unclassified Bosea (in: a-proteobacteria)]TAJ31916.1 MAG: ABC transporter substrate-binding protein [Bosea sp. (in: a-proteobacteria)]SIR12487.1 peptide/nickel transport system substrate-binding protein [Bosea sp. TND4EK4]